MATFEQDKSVKFDQSVNIIVDGKPHHYIASTMHYLKGEYAADVCIENLTDDLVTRLMDEGTEKRLAWGGLIYPIIRVALMPSSDNIVVVTATISRFAYGFDCPNSFCASAGGRPAMRNPLETEELPPINC